VSYLGYSKILARDFLSLFDKPIILEIGLDRGQTALPLLYNMSLYCDEFKFIGVDIKLQSEFTEQITQLGDLKLPGDKERGKKEAEFYETSSMTWLSTKSLQEKYRGKIDLVMIDGDHNYHTVYNELKMLENFTHERTLYICDDYYGKHSQLDNFITETGAEFQRNNKHLGEPVRLEKKGVKNAIDDYLRESPWEWSVLTCDGTEPCLMWRKDHLNLKIVFNDDKRKFRNSKMVVKFNNNPISVSTLFGYCDTTIPVFNNKK
tara:strand:+ start:917 stop:1702 length:786 start_codon:yes stop_codon:yes gene_type:complete